MGKVLRADGSVKSSVLPYLRVSTEDKGQDPKRQLLSIASWAEREDFQLLGPEEDIGTSASKVPALERPFFIRACERAQAARAAGLIIETPDRFSRMDPMLAVWEFVEVEKRFGLDIYFACVPLSYQATPMGRLVIFLQMASSHQWVIDHTAKVVSGMLRKKAEGAKFGRKPKNLRADELDQVKELRRKDRKEGQKGWETIAVIINEQRGVHRLTDKKEAKEQGVSSGSLRRMATQGLFGSDEMRREDRKGGTPDETDSSPSRASDQPADILPSGGGGT